MHFLQSPAIFYVAHLYLRTLLSVFLFCPFSKAILSSRHIRPGNVERRFSGAQEMSRHSAASYMVNANCSLPSPAETEELFWVLKKRMLQQSDLYMMLIFTLLQYLEGAFSHIPLEPGSEQFSDSCSINRTSIKPETDLVKNNLPVQCLAGKNILYFWEPILIMISWVKSTLWVHWVKSTTEIIILSFCLMLTNKLSIFTNIKAIPWLIVTSWIHK